MFKVGCLVGKRAHLLADRNDRKLAAAFNLIILITNDYNISAEINSRITLANRSYFGLVNILKAKDINRKYEVIIYKTLIKPVLMYGAEARVLSRVDEARLAVFEIKILRKMYEPLCEGVTRRSRHNEELYRLYDEIDLLTAIRISKHTWAGHIVRMQDNLPRKKITSEHTPAIFTS
jgi:hypothetical protein